MISGLPNFQYFHWIWIKRKKYFQIADHIKLEGIVNILEDRNIISLRHAVSRSRHGKDSRIAFHCWRVKEEES